MDTHDKNLIEQNLIREKIHRAYNTLLFKDAHLLSVDANERSLTHKLGEYLQFEFGERNVDCEYNRNGVDIKKLGLPKKQIYSDDLNAVKVYPDIIIHHRGTNNNLVVIEAKKSNNRADQDEEKLQAYIEDLNYKHAYKITFPVGSDFTKFDDMAEHIKRIEHKNTTN